VRVGQSPAAGSSDKETPPHGITSNTSPDRDRFLAEFLIRHGWCRKNGSAPSKSLCGTRRKNGAAGAGGSKRYEADAHVGLSKILSRPGSVR